MATKSVWFDNYENESTFRDDLILTLANINNNLARLINLFQEREEAECNGEGGVKIYRRRLADLKKINSANFIECTDKFAVEGPHYDYIEVEDEDTDTQEEN
ncbi:MAG: hypothetical protein IJG62_05745 [Synergistaceae bacterium]|nr:hypothetical protein [Synergistaceae bacterium]